MGNAKFCDAPGCPNLVPLGVAVCPTPHNIANPYPLARALAIRASTRKAGRR